MEYILGDLAIDNIPQIVVLGKADLVDPAQREEWLAQGRLLVSALEGENLDVLLERIETELAQTLDPQPPRVVEVT